MTAACRNLNCQDALLFVLYLLQVINCHVCEYLVFNSSFNSNANVMKNNCALFYSVALLLMFFFPSSFFFSLLHHFHPILSSAARLSVA